MKEYIVKQAISTKERTIELRKYFSGSFSVADIDSHGNTSEEFKSNYGKAEEVYKEKTNKQ